MVHSLSQIYTHIVFHVNINEPIRIPINLQPRLHAYIAKTCHIIGSPSIIVGGMDDHVHVLCRISRNISPAKLLEKLKTESSKWIKTLSVEFGSSLSNFSWQNGYGIFSVSASKVEAVKQYISNQIEHHRTRSFKDEYLILLKKHKVDYDEKYLWS